MKCEQALRDAPAARRQSDGAVAVPRKDCDQVWVSICEVTGVDASTWDVGIVPGDDWEPLETQTSWETASKKAQTFWEASSKAMMAELDRRKERIAELESGAAFVGEPIEGDLVEIAGGEFYWSITPDDTTKVRLFKSVGHTTIRGGSRGLLWRYTGPTTAPLPEAKPQPSERQDLCDGPGDSEPALLECFDDILDALRFDTDINAAARAELADLLAARKGGE